MIARFTLEWGIGHHVDRGAGMWVHSYALCTSKYAVSFRNE